MTIVICPGMHSSALTDEFLAGLGKSSAEVCVFPVDRYPAYSGWHIFNFWVQESALASDRAAANLLVIGFSAGVVGALAAAHLWQCQKGQIKALIAIDGWGVPLYANFPTHRLSHDYFTHWSSIGWGNSLDSFYAEPAVEHLHLWRSPQTCWGQPVSRSDAPVAQPRNTSTSMSGPTTAAQFLINLLAKYDET